MGYREIFIRYKVREIILPHQSGWGGGGGNAPPPFIKISNPFCRSLLLVTRPSHQHTYNMNTLVRRSSYICNTAQCTLQKYLFDILQKLHNEHICLFKYFVKLVFRITQLRRFEAIHSVYFVFITVLYFYSVKN